MKISKQILIEMQACSIAKGNGDGLDKFVAMYGDKEILFSECVKSESNSISDYFWFIRNYDLSDVQMKDIKDLAVECAERFLYIIENKRPHVVIPKSAVETATRYLDNKVAKGELNKCRKGGDAEYAVVATYDVYADAAGKSWQKQRLAEIVLSWGW